MSSSDITSSGGHLHAHLRHRRVRLDRLRRRRRAARRRPRRRRPRSLRRLRGQGRRARRRGPPRLASRTSTPCARCRRRATASSTSATTTTSARWTRPLGSTRDALETLGGALGRRRAVRDRLRASPGCRRDRPATERDAADPSRHPRIAASQQALALADRGVRTVEARFAPTVHGTGDHGFISVLVRCRPRARRLRRTSATAPTAGPRCTASTPPASWPRRSTSAPPGTVLHAVAEQGVPTRDIAEAIGRGLGLPVESVPAERGGRALRLDRDVLRHGRRRVERPHPRAARTGSRPDRPCSRTSPQAPTLLRS